jgi:hypothetical protein
MWSYPFREENVENRVVREKLEPKRDEVNGKWMILC